MLVRDLMSREVVTAQSGDSVAAVRDLLRARGIHHLLIVRDGTVEGVVSQRDLMLTTRGTVADVMKREFATIDASASLKRAAALMLGNTSGCLPVLENGRLAGIITTTDLMRAVNADVTFA